jgi:acyl carrier protein
MFKKIVVALLVAGATAFAPAAFVGRRVATPLFMADAVEDKVKDIIVSQLGVDADKVVNAATFVDDLGADSLDTVELIMAIEEEFDCEIPEEEAANISTVQQVRVVRRTRRGPLGVYADRARIRREVSHENMPLLSLSLSLGH